MLISRAELRLSAFQAENEARSRAGGYIFPFRAEKILQSRAERCHGAARADWAADLRVEPRSTLGGFGGRIPRRTLAARLNFMANLPACPLA